MGVVSGAIQSLGNLGVAKMNQSSQRQANNTYLQGVRETNQANKDLAQQQNQWNLEQWQRENEYNAPSQQVQRLKEAGLSSAAASQAIEGAGNAASIQSADLANQQAAQPLQGPQFDLNAIPSLLGMMRELVEMRKSSSEADIKEKENSFFNRVMMTDLDAKQADIDFKKYELYQLQQSWPYSFQALKYNTHAAAYNPAIKAQELENAEANNELINMNVKRVKQDFEWLGKMREQEFKQMLQTIKNLEKQYEVYSSEINKNNAMSDVAQEQKKLTKAQYISQGLDNILKEHGSPDSVAGRTAAMYAKGVLSLDDMTKALEGVKQYEQKGRDMLSNDPATKDYWMYLYDEGKARSTQTGFHTLGGARQAFETISDFFTPSTRSNP